ncbi:hypothetical protein KIPB_011878, partial [Kipferlia bialata]|eukprot:g11878.t1
MPLNLFLERVPLHGNACYRVGRDSHIAVGADRILLLTSGWIYTLQPVGHTLPPSSSSASITDTVFDTDSSAHSGYSDPDIESEPPADTNSDTEPLWTTCHTQCIGRLVLIYGSIYYSGIRDYRVQDLHILNTVSGYVYECNPVLISCLFGANMFSPSLGIVRTDHTHLPSNMSFMDRGYVYPGNTEVEGEGLRVGERETLMGWAG